MNVCAQNTLREMGKQLDRNVFPRVQNGGFVVLNELAVPSTLGMERKNGKERERGSAARSRQGTAGRERPPGGAWPPGDPASVIGRDRAAQYDIQLSALAEQYPGAQFWHHEDGVWLLTMSRFLPELRQHAIFLTGISFPGQMVRSWAFWADVIAYPKWIGPRHTNFPDGSICAFEPKDGTWSFGDPLVELLDLYTVWAIRHLYFEQFGRWPGYQSIHFPGERILELRADEHCGCANGDKLYGECCMPKDLAGNRIGESLKFHWLTGGVRKPPESVENYVRSGKQLPSLRKLVTASSPFSILSSALGNRIATTPA